MVKHPFFVLLLFLVCCGNRNFEVFLFPLSAFQGKKGGKVIYGNRTWATFQHSAFRSAKRGSQFSPKKNQRKINSTVRNEEFNFFQLIREMCS